MGTCLCKLRQTFHSFLKTLSDIFHSANVGYFFPFIPIKMNILNVSVAGSQVLATINIDAALQQMILRYILF